MDYRVLGPLEVSDGDGPLALGGPKQRALLALLLLSANRVVSRERLIDELWGAEPPASAVTSLQVYVSRLRKLLPPGALQTRPPGYVLAVEPEQVDLLRFERLRAEARQAQPERASDLLREALAISRGPPLAEFPETFARVDGARLEELRLAALETRIEADLALGRHADLVAELERVVAEHPHRERLRSQLMLALYRCDRQAEALAAYCDARAALDELGIKPSEHLRELERAILTQDPALARPAPVAVTTPLSPYLGLRPFEEGDAALFFGREELVAELLARLTKSSLLAEVVDGIGEGLRVGGRAVLGVRGHEVDRPRFPASASGAPPAFHLLAKPTGAVCNLDCSYCFFLSKEMLYPGSRFRMADGLLDAYLRQLIEAHAQAPEVVVAWQGGEPTLMGVDFFRRSVELAECHLRPGQRAVYSMQTNGTLLDDEWGAFLREHHFLVGLSIDGPREVHDTYRVNKGGRGSFDEVMGGLAVLHRHDVEFNTLTTLHAANAGRAREVYRFLRDECGSRFHQYIPIVERVADGGGDVAWASWRDRPLYVQEGEAVSARSITGEQYGRFLIDVFEEWVRRDVGEVYVQMFDVALANWVGEPPGLCVHSETCGLSLALEHTGDVYSCDHFVEPAYRLGNIEQEHMLTLVASPQQRAFGLAKRDALPRYCRECDVRFACQGGCPKDRFVRTPGGEPGLNYLCAGYKAFFHHVDAPMRFMADRLRRGLAPADVVARYRAEDANRGRNDLCTCASGRKWKHCHGAGPSRS